MIARLLPKEFRYGLLQLRLTIAELDSLSPDTQTCEQDACVSYSVYRRVSRDDRYTAVGKMFLAAPLEETRSALQSKCSKLDDALQLHAVTRIPPTRPPTHRSSALSLMSVLLFPVRAPYIEQLPTTMLQKNKEFLEKQLLEMGKNLEVRATITPSNHFRQLPTSRWLRCCQELMAAQQE